MTFKKKLPTSQHYCAWELPPIYRDRHAWVRHIRMPKVPDRDGYLADSMPSGHTR